MTEYVLLGDTTHLPPAVKRRLNACSDEVTDQSVDSDVSVGDETDDLQTPGAHVANPEVLPLLGAGHCSQYICTLGGAG